LHHITCPHPIATIVSAFIDAMGDKENDGHCHTVPVHSVMQDLCVLMLADTIIFAEKYLEITTQEGRFSLCLDSRCHKKNVTPCLSPCDGDAVTLMAVIVRISVLTTITQQ